MNPVSQRRVGRFLCTQGLVEFLIIVVLSSLEDKMKFAIVPGKNPDGDADRSDYIILNDFILNCGNL